PLARAEYRPGRRGRHDPHLAAEADQMKHVVIGAHLERGDVEPPADAIPVSDLWLSGLPIDDAQPLGDRELLLRVAQTRAALLDRATFIAIRYGFTAYGESDAAARCAAHIE